MSYKVNIIFVVTGILIGAFISSQFRTAAPVGSLFPVDQLEAKKVLIKSYVDEQALLQGKIVSLRKAIEENQEKNELISRTANLALLDELKKLIGLTPVSGSGVEIVLDDSPFARRESAEVLDKALIHAADLRDAVNLLQASHATAIAINQQRVIATTSIASVGNSILVNNSYLVPPFIITATGDPEISLRRLMDASALPDLYKRKAENHIHFSFKVNKTLVIPVYNGDLRFKYLTQAQ